MGKKSSENLLAGIAASKERGLARLLNALSIRHVGTRVATVLAEHFGSIEASAAASVEELSEVQRDRADHRPERLRVPAQSTSAATTIDDLRELGVKMTAAAVAATPRAWRLAGQDAGRDRHAQQSTAATRSKS